ncbi:MAG: Hint domain-containing protein [Pseudomonadota bacterium]
MGSRTPPDWAATGFATGTFVQTTRGLRPIERLVPGEDEVEFRDGSSGKLMRLLSHTFTASALERNTALRPVRIPALALGGTVPARNLIVSQDMHIHAQGRLVRRVTEAAEVLLPVAALIGKNDVELITPVSGITYFHLVSENHQVLKAEGLVCETLYLGDETEAARHDPDGPTHVSPILPRLDLEMANRLTEKLAKKNRAPVSAEGS